MIICYSVESQVRGIGLSEGVQQWDLPTADIDLTDNDSFTTWKEWCVVYQGTTNGGLAIICRRAKTSKMLLYNPFLSL